VVKSEVNLTPFIPLSFLRRGGGEKKRGFAPLRYPVKLVSFKGGGEIERGVSSHYPIGKEGETPKCNREF
jgi:hypothetical protein